MLQVFVTVTITDVLLLCPCLLNAHLCAADWRTEMHNFSRDSHLGNGSFLFRAAQSLLQAIAAQETQDTSASLSSRAKKHK